MKYLISVALVILITTTVVFSEEVDNKKEWADSLEKYTYEIFTTYDNYVMVINSQLARLEAKKRGMKDAPDPYTEIEMENFFLLQAMSIALIINEVGNKQYADAILKTLIDKNMPFGRKIYMMYLDLL